MNMKKHTALMILLMLIMVACGAQTPSPDISAAPTDQPATVPVAATSTSTSMPEATPTSTFTPEATSTLSPDELGSVQFESIKMFDESGTGDIRKTSGWAVALLADGNEYVLHTDDGGQTWFRSALSSGPYYGFSAPIFLSAQIAWNTNPDNILEQTRDGGRTWVSLFDFGNNSNQFSSVDLRFWDANNGILISGVPGAGISFLALNRTYDGGMNWNKMDLTPLPDHAVSTPGELELCNLCTDMLYIDSSRIMIVYGLFATQTLDSAIEFAISLDEGKSWKHGQAIVPEKLIGHTARFGAMTFFDDQNGAFSFWSSYKNAPLDFTEYSTLFSYYTNDGGITWSSGTPTPTADTDEDYVDYEKFLSPTDAIVRWADKLCVTHDGAQTWTPIWPDLKFPISSDSENWIVDLDFIDPKLGFSVISTSAGAIELYQTIDGGRHWTQIEYQLIG